MRKLSMTLPIEAAFSPNRVVGNFKKCLKDQRKVCRLIFRSSDLLGVVGIEEWKKELKNFSGHVIITIEERAISPLDPDNLVAGCKCAIDEFKHIGILKDDGCDYVELRAKSTRIQEWDKGEILFTFEMP